MPRLLLATALAAACLAPAGPAAGDTILVGDAGNTTGVRVDAPGVLYFNCGIGNRYGNPSMDLQLLGGPDNLADADFDGPEFLVPQACEDLGERVTVGV